MTPVTSPADPRLSRCTSYLKGEPKALGTVQIMIGILILLIGIVLTSYALTSAVLSGIMLWGSLVFVISGSLTVASENNPKSCRVKASLGMNVFSAVVSGLDIILFSLDMVFGEYFLRWHSPYHDDRHFYNYRYLWRIPSVYYGIYGVLLVFALLEFIISIYTSVFTCKASCFTATKPLYSQLTTQVMQTQPLNLQPMNNPAYNQVPQQQPPSIAHNV